MSARGLHLTGSRHTSFTSKTWKTLILKTCVLFLKFPHDYRYSKFLNHYTVDCLSQHPLCTGLCRGRKRMKEEGRRNRFLFSVNCKENFPKLHLLQYQNEPFLLKPTKCKDLYFKKYAHPPKHISVGVLESSSDHTRLLSKFNFTTIRSGPYFTPLFLSTTVKRIEKALVGEQWC